MISCFRGQKRSLPPEIAFLLISCPAGARAGRLGPAPLCSYLATVEAAANYVREALVLWSLRGENQSRQSGSEPTLAGKEVTTKFCQSEWEAEARLGFVV